MRRLKTTILILGVMILGIAASFGSYLVLTASQVRGQPPENGPQKDIWVVDTVEEATMITGYPIRRPQFLPDGFAWEKISVAQPTIIPGGNVLPKRVFYGASLTADNNVGFFVQQDPTLGGFGDKEKEAVDIGGFSGQRVLLPPLPPGRPTEMLLLYLPDGKNGGYVVGGPLTGTLTEETYRKILLSISRN